MPSPLNPDFGHRPHAARVIAAGVPWAVDLISQQQLLLKRLAQGRGLGQERLGEAVSQVSQALLLEFYAATGVGSAQLRTIQRLAKTSETSPKHVQLLLNQPLDLLTMALYEWTVRNAMGLPPAHLLRVIVWSETSTVQTAYGVDEGPNGTHTLTMIGLVAECPGVCSLLLTQMPLISGTRWDPARMTEKQLAGARAKAPDAPFPHDFAEHVDLLLDRVRQFQELVSAVYGMSVALPADLTLTGGSWRHGSDRTPSNVLVPRVAAAGEQPRLLESLHALGQPAVLAIGLSDTGPHVGSLSERLVYQTEDAREIIGRDFLRGIFTADGPLGSELDEFMLDDLADDGRSLRERAGIAQDVRYFLARGGIVVGRHRRPFILRRQPGSEPMVVTFNFEPDAAAVRLLQSSEALHGLLSDAGRRECLKRFYAAHGAPFGAQATSHVIRQGMGHLAALVNVAVVAAGRNWQPQPAIV